MSDLRKYALKKYLYTEQSALFGFDKGTISGDFRY